MYRVNPTWDGQQESTGCRFARILSFPLPFWCHVYIYTHSISHTTRQRHRTFYGSKNTILKLETIESERKMVFPTDFDCIHIFSKKAKNTCIFIWLTGFAMSTCPDTYTIHIYWSSNICIKHRLVLSGCHFDSYDVIFCVLLFSHSASLKREISCFFSRFFFSLVLLKFKRLTISHWHMLHKYLKELPLNDTHTKIVSIRRQSGFYCHVISHTTDV